MNLTRFDGENGIELVIDVNTGESFATVSGYARMSGINRTTVQMRVKDVNSDLAKTAEIQTQGGLQGVRLLSEDLICEWLPKDNPKMATQLMKLGVRMCLHQLVGFNMPVQQEKPLAFLGEPVERSPKEIKEDCETIDQILGNVSFADSAETARFKLMASCYPLRDLVAYIDFSLLKKMWSLSPGALADQLKMDLPQARMILFHVCYDILKDEFPESLSSLMDWINSSLGAQLPFIADEVKFLGKSKK
ncbi:hypothetical protein [Cyanothece sp. BG0011]|uniref:hypothetical protein n=1 Tax=Cyanothece sp. BG0011 TaxID=2082950 RepID=UPI000D1FC664|nr:hypothetical protein [Cyanothece sp. BG0011]